MGIKGIPGPRFSTKLKENGIHVVFVSELANMVYMNCDYTRDVCLHVAAKVVAQLAAALEAGNAVDLRNVGILYPYKLKIKEGRLARNKKGEYVPAKAKNHIRFRESKHLFQQINKGTTK